MKSIRPLRRVATVAALAFLSTFNLSLAPSARAQGSLTPPPGAPAPVMKSLDQIEPRISVNSLAGTSNAMHIIQQPGNYYLTANIVGTAGKHGIIVDAHDVTINLNGFTIIGTGGGTSRGITLNGDESGVGARLSVRNGIIQNWGGGGIVYYGQHIDLLEDLNFRDCKGGIVIEGADSIRRCLVRGGSGASVGIFVGSGYTRVEDCRVDSISPSSGGGSGIIVSYGSVENCTVRSVGGDPAIGIKVADGNGLVANCKVREIYGSATTSIGISATTVRDCLVVDGYSFQAARSLTGIVGQHIERCTVKGIAAGDSAGRGVGIQGIGTGGLIEQCVVDGISGGGATGIRVSTNRFSVINTKVSNVVGKGSITQGINSESGSLTASGCDVSGVTNSTDYAFGIYANGGLIERCNVSRTRNAGIYANSNCSVVNCRVDEAGMGGGGAGIWSLSTRNRIENNHVVQCDFGIQAPSGSSGVVLRNVCSGNTTNYSVPGALVAPLVTSTEAATATNPFANLSL